jgi:pyrroline-5-carboxylate reductase
VTADTQAPGDGVISTRVGKIAFVGGGNMAQSLVGGLIRRGWPARPIVVADPVAAQREKLARLFGVRTMADNARAVDDTDLVVLAVKPQDVAAVCDQIRDTVSRIRPLVLSIVAGVGTTDIATRLGGVDVIRAMPNRPALLGSGATALYATASVSDVRRTRAQEVMDAVGTTVWVDTEAQMDVVTAVSGSGPAYFFLLIEMLEEAGSALGLDAAIARRLAIETAHGAARMARETGASPVLLREQVTSSGGTTAAALAVLEDARVRDIFRRAVAAAAARSAELARELADR